MFFFFFLDQTTPLFDPDSQEKWQNIPWVIIILCWCIKPITVIIFMSPMIDHVVNQLGPTKSFSHRPMADMVRKWLARLQIIEWINYSSNFPDIVFHLCERKHTWAWGWVRYCQSNKSCSCNKGEIIGILFTVDASFDDSGDFGSWKSFPASIIKTLSDSRPAAIVKPAAPPPTKMVPNKHSSF